MQPIWMQRRYTRMCMRVRIGEKNMNNNKETIMPEVSRFYGIVIKMFFKPKEHEPAHIHALYDEYMGVFDIETFEMTEGDMPNRAQKMVREWLTEHKSELQKMWQTQKIVKLPPLKD